MMNHRRNQRRNDHLIRNQSAGRVQEEALVKLFRAAENCSACEPAASTFGELGDAEEAGGFSGQMMSIRFRGQRVSRGQPKQLRESPGAGWV